MVSITLFPILCIMNLVRARYTCNASNAIPMKEDSPSQSGGETNPSSSDVYTESSFADEGYSNSMYAIDGSEKRSLQPRASTSFQCADAEVCAVLLWTSFMCVDPLSGDFHDSNGRSGNINSYTYTMSNGVVTRLASTVTQLPTAIGTGSASKATATLAGTATKIASTTSTAESKSESANSSSAAAKFMMNDVLGMVSFTLATAYLWR